MTWYFRHAEAGENPITTLEEYNQLRGRYKSLREQVERAQQHGPLDTEHLRMRDEANALLESLRKRLPYVLLSRCPFCDREIWQKSRLFSLEDEYWYLTYDSGRDVHRDSFCPHLFCVDGALNLNGHQPSEARGSTNPNKKITIAAEVPFVKPRVLKLPTMVAVVHRLPVADRYTAYPIVYFAEQQPPQEEFCIPWARVEYFAQNADGYGTITGKRADSQEYDLKKWVEAGKLFWLDPATPEGRVVRGPASAFPYDQVTGRRHPYTIENGKVSNQWNPWQGGPKIKRDSGL